MKNMRQQAMDALENDKYTWRIIEKIASRIYDYPHMEKTMCEEIINLFQDMIVVEEDDETSTDSARFPAVYNYYEQSETDLELVVLLYDELFGDDIRPYYANNTYTYIIHGCCTVAPAVCWIQLSASWLTTSEGYMHLGTGVMR